jgi:peptidoglycan hydrolase-like protein with peptidoglycan-binding domain
VQEVNMEGVDYAWDRPNLDQLWAAGKRFVFRYLAYDNTGGYGANGKVLRAPERAALHAKGFGIVLNWEQAAGDMLKGYDKGAQHAREALRQANALGAPGDAPIYFSCDVDTNSSGRTAVAEYLRACGDVLGLARVGVYGEADVIDAMVPTRAKWGWQTYAWSGGQTSEKAHVKQYKNGVTVAGADCDLNVSLKSEWGVWWPSAVAPPTVPGPDWRPALWSALPVLRRGSKGWQVRKVQALVNVAIGAGLSEDGDFGPATEAGVKRFQSSRGLASDGVVGVVTWGALSAGALTVRRGSTGAPVGALQALLNVWGKGVAEDKDFGPATEKALKEWQARYNVPGGADGVAGQGTWTYALGS